MVICSLTGKLLFKKRAVARGPADFFAVPPGGMSQVAMLACGPWFLDLTQPPRGPSCRGTPSWVVGTWGCLESSRYAQRPDGLSPMWLLYVFVPPFSSHWGDLDYPKQLPAPDPFSLLSIHCLFAQKPARASRQGGKNYKGTPSCSPRPWAALGALHSLTFSHSPACP